MEEYKFLIIDMFFTPFFVLDEDTGLPKNFDTYEEAKEYGKNVQEPLIVDVKKLQYENEADDISADMSW